MRDTGGMGALILLAIWLGWGFWAAALRARRNRSTGAGWALGLLLGPIGVLIAALQSTDPTLKLNPGTSPTSQFAPKTKPCPFCAEVIQAAALKCRYCGSDLAA